MNTYSIKAYAKINLGLDVCGRLENGYHIVKMIMQSVGIYDELIFTKTDGPVILKADGTDLPLDENNLIVKAVELMRKEYGIRDGVSVELTKNIPIAAGMAGGSTDAAAALKAMNVMFELGLSEERLIFLIVLWAKRPWQRESARSCIDFLICLSAICLWQSPILMSLPNMCMSTWMLRQRLLTRILMV